MPIELQCSSCGKKISAPDSAGGKWGKCPACHTRIFVPLPSSVAEEDELKLAPLDETEEQKQKQLMLETYRLTQDILQEQNAPEAPTGIGPVPDISDEKLTDHIVRYLRQMANSQLDEAQRTADAIVPHRRKAVTILDDFAKNYPPDPELADVSQQLLLRFIRNLKTRIS